MSDKLTLFIDESGRASLQDVSEPQFLLTGVVIQNKDIPTIEGFFNFIKWKHSLCTPQEDKPFHSYDIFENPTCRVTETRAKQLSETLAEYISLIPVHPKVVTINKIEFREALGIKSNDDFKGGTKRKETKDFPYRILASTLFTWFAQILVKKEKTGEIVADSRKGGDSQLLKTFHQWKDGTDRTSTGLTKTTKGHITAISFAEKNYLSGGLEITDLISYVTFLRERQLLTSTKSLGLDKIWKELMRRIEVEKLGKTQIRRFFGIKEGEVYKYLKKQL